MSITAEQAKQMLASNNKKIELSVKKRKHIYDIAVMFLLENISITKEALYTQTLRRISRNPELSNSGITTILQQLIDEIMLSQPQIKRLVDEEDVGKLNKSLTLNVVVVLKDGKTHELQIPCQPKDSVLSFKERIAKEFPQYPTALQNLSYMGVSMADEDSLATYQIGTDRSLACYISAPMSTLTTSVSALSSDEMRRFFGSGFITFSFNTSLTEDELYTQTLVGQGIDGTRLPAGVAAIYRNLIKEIMLNKPLLNRKFGESSSKELIMPLTLSVVVVKDGKNEELQISCSRKDSVLSIKERIAKEYLAYPVASQNLSIAGVSMNDKYSLEKYKILDSHRSLACYISAPMNSAGSSVASSSSNNNSVPEVSDKDRVHFFLKAYSILKNTVTLSKEALYAQTLEQLELDGSSLSAGVALVCDHLINEVMLHQPLLKRMNNEKLNTSVKLHVVVLKDGTKKELQISCLCGDSVLSVKEKIAKEHRDEYPAILQNLSYLGLSMKNEDSLLTCGVDDNAYLICQIRQPVNVHVARSSDVEPRAADKHEMKESYSIVSKKLGQLESTKSDSKTKAETMTHDLESQSSSSSSTTTLNYFQIRNAALLEEMRDVIKLLATRGEDVTAYREDLNHYEVLSQERLLSQNAGFVKLLQDLGKQLGPVPSSSFSS